MGCAAADQRRLSGTILRKKARPLLGRLNQAYISLLLIPESKDGSRTVSLARYGVYEVRLVEFAHLRSGDASPLWITLYRKDIQSPLDNCRCDDLDDAEVAAARLVSRARQLHKTHAACRPLVRSG